MPHNAGKHFCSLGQLAKQNLCDTEHHFSVWQSTKLASVGHNLEKYYMLSSVVWNRAECYDYLFEMGVQMKHAGLDPTAIPVYCEGAYTSKVHVDEHKPSD